MANIGSVASAGVTLLGYIGIAYSAYTIVKQLGKAFGWWGKEIKTNSQKLDESIEKLEEFRIAMNKVGQEKLSLKEIESVLDNLKEFEKYDINVDRDMLFNPDLKARDAYIKGLKDSLNDIKGTVERADLKKEFDDLLEWFDPDWKFKGKKVDLFNIDMTGGQWENEFLRNTDKFVEDKILRLRELKEQLDLIDKTDNIFIEVQTAIKPTTWADLDTKSDLDKYYDMVKFADSNYYGWKKTQIKIGIDELGKRVVLIKELHTEEEVKQDA